MIHRITIRNFRSLSDVTVDLDEVTVLIGKSGTGKSNFVRAIRFLRDIVAARGSHGHQDWANVAHVSRRGQPTEFYVRFSVPGWDEPADYDLVIAQQVVKVERVRFGERTLFSHRDGRWEVTPDVTPQPNPQGIVLGTLNGMAEVNASFVTLTRGLGCYDFPGNVLQPSNANTPTPGHGRGLNDSGANYLAVVQDVTADFQRPRTWKQLTEPLTKLNAAVVSVNLQQPDQNQLVVTHQLGGHKVLFDVAQESEGFRRFLAHLLALYQSPPKQTLLFEHPENGIHPGALATLFEQFEDCPGDDRGQVILTTHSPQLLDHFPPETIRVVELQDQQTRIGPLDPELAGVIRDKLLYPGELLTKKAPTVAEPAEAP